MDTDAVVRTALNTHRSWWQRHRREVMADVDAAVTELPAETDASLMAAVLRLPLRQRQVIGCRLFLDLDTAQTAGVTALALAAVAAISGVTLASGASSTSGTSHAQLTAWTVQKQTDGTIDVTIHDLLDLAGLQQKLNADGVPAEVITDAHYPASCVNYTAMKEDMASVITNGPGVPDGYAFVIHPAGIPSGSKLLLDVTRLTTVTSGGVTTTVGGVGDRLWGFGVSGGPRATGKGAVSVSVGMGLAHNSGNC